MGCILGCFRIDEDDKRKSHSLSRWIPFKRKDPFPSKKEPTSTFEYGGSSYNPLSCLRSRNKADADGLNRELVNEAKFLKSCGALKETPEEIQKISKRISALSHEEHCYTSWFPCTPFMSLTRNEKLDQLAMAATNIHEESIFPENNHSGFNSRRHQAQRHYDNILPSVTSSQPAHLEAVNRNSSVEACMEPVNLDTPSQTYINIQPRCSNLSPYPTPLKLTEEMQTPLTVYPADIESHRTQRDARVRTQYVRPVLYSVENIPQRPLGQPSKFYSQQIKSSSIDDVENSDKIQKRSPTSLPMGSLSLSPSDNEREKYRKTVNEENYLSGNCPSSVTPPLGKREVALSPENPQLPLRRQPHWLKPLIVNDEKGNTETIAEENSHPDMSVDGDRPILGAVATYWDAYEPCISPKFWDGNGIPNTTRKYKEDQRVSWHATPFEQRLEKVLSGDKAFPPRKLNISKPMEVDDRGR